ncbi:MAG TPA: DUF4058 family protein [Chloroflexi bacterium]|nr:DUF4058 family protein [Chloroflexota bacterium]
MNKSPFPGMDPYLEGEWWQEFHHTLATEIRRMLMKTMPSRYVALLDKYYTIDYSGSSVAVTRQKRRVQPDLQLLQVKEAVAKYETVAAPMLELLSPLPEEIPIIRIKIQDVAERRLVTVIEILSPANKYGKGFEEYAEKRTALLQTETHLLEIDLLRKGRRIPLIGGELPPAPYYVFLSRSNRRPHTEVWPVQLRESLPAVPVPLLPPDPDVPLALQGAIEACFELVGYQRLLDYARPLPPPILEANDLIWVESITQTKGITNGKKKT